jgi:hypothetical protein
MLRPTVRTLNASSKLAFVRCLPRRALLINDPDTLFSVLTSEMLLEFGRMSFRARGCSRTGDENNSRFRGFKKSVMASNSCISQTGETEMMLSESSDFVLIGESHQR